MVKEYKTKDSGIRKKYDSGLIRDVQNDKPRFDLLIPNNQKYEDTLLYRWAMLLERGSKKYDDRNWENANTIEELNRFKASAWRHFIQAMSGEVDEDYFAAAVFNLNAVVFLMDTLNVDIKGEKNNGS